MIVALHASGRNIANNKIFQELIWRSQTVTPNTTVCAEDSHEEGTAHLKPQWGAVYCQVPMRSAIFLIIATEPHPRCVIDALRFGGREGGRTVKEERSREGEKSVSGRGDKRRGKEGLKAFTGRFTAYRMSESTGLTFPVHFVLTEQPCCYAVSNMYRLYLFVAYSFETLTFGLEFNMHILVDTHNTRAIFIFHNAQDVYNDTRYIAYSLLLIFSQPMLQGPYCGNSWTTDTGVSEWLWNRVIEGLHNNQAQTK